jgi:hypothetical protein
MLITPFTDYSPIVQDMCLSSTEGWDFIPKNWFSCSGLYDARFTPDIFQYIFWLLGYSSPWEGSNIIQLLLTNRRGQVTIFSAKKSIVTLQWRSFFVGIKLIPAGETGLLVIVHSQHSREVKVTLPRQK